MRIADKDRALELLRELAKEMTTEKIIEGVSGVESAPAHLPSSKQLATMAKGDYKVAQMQHRTFVGLVWLLEYYGKMVDINKSENPEILGAVLQRFVNLNPESIEGFAKNITGNYQGYRLSIKQPGRVILFHLSVVYDEKNNTLLTRETVKNPQIRSSEIFEGTMVVNAENQRVCYIVARVVKNPKITGLQFTTINSLEDGDGAIIQMSGVVTGPNTDVGVFTRNVVFVRSKQELIKTLFMPVDDFLHMKDLEQQNVMLLELLRKPIDPHLNTTKEN